MSGNKSSRERILPIIVLVGVIVVIALSGKIIAVLGDAYYTASQNSIKQLVVCTEAKDARVLGWEAVDKHDPSACLALPESRPCRGQDGKGGGDKPWERSFEEPQATCLSEYAETYPTLEVCQALEVASENGNGLDECYLRVAVEMSNVSICDSLLDIYGATVCRAIVNKDPQYCLDLTVTLFDRIGQNNSLDRERSHDLQITQDSCIDSVVDLTKDASFCKLLVPVDDDVDLFKVYQKLCENNATRLAPAMDWYRL